jgi:hypothetical protein
MGINISVKEDMLKLTAISSGSASCTAASQTVQHVHKVREHFKLFIAQELQIIQTSYTCHSEEKL